MQSPTTHQLSEPLPRRHWTGSAETGFHSEQWTPASVLKALRGGGRFTFHVNYHEFDSRDTAAFAAQAQHFFNEARA